MNKNGLKPDEAFVIALIIKNIKTMHKIGVPINIILVKLQVLKLTVLLISWSLAISFNTAFTSSKLILF